MEIFPSLTRFRCILLTWSVVSPGEMNRPRQLKQHNVIGRLLQMTHHSSFLLTYTSHFFPFLVDLMCLAAESLIYIRILVSFEPFKEATSIHSERYLFLKATRKDLAPTYCCLISEEAPKVSAFHITIIMRKPRFQVRSFKINCFLISFIH